jgi:replication-associated recombination protein RarA
MKLTCRLLHRISNAKQKYVFMFGPPGVEKETFAELLTKDLAFNYISTG